MKRYKIVHKTEYTYPNLVELFPHTLRLRPREGHDLRIESSLLEISPTATLRWIRDVEGNTIAKASFCEPTQRLSVTSEIVVQQYDNEPLDFLVPDYAVNYPFNYLEDDKGLLSVYMKTPGSKASYVLDDFVSYIQQTNKDPQTFSVLSELNEIVNQSIQYKRRDIEGIQSAEKTLELATGSCRDLAHLFIMTARELGFSARFVSGYLHSGISGTLYGSTHAWAEVFIPGAGWKGFDPTHSTIVGPDHIAVSVAKSPDAVPPVSGKFNGTPGSNMQAVVMVKQLS